MTPDRFHEESLGRCDIAPGAEPEVDRLSRAVNSKVKIDPFATDSPLGVRGITAVHAAKAALTAVSQEDAERKAGQEPKVADATPTTYSYLDVSTGHLSRKTIEFLETVSGTNIIRLMVAAYEHGLWVSVPENAEYDIAIDELSYHAFSRRPTCYASEVEGRN